MSRHQKKRQNKNKSARHAEKGQHPVPQRDTGASVQQLLQMAVHHHGLGDLKKAHDMYRDVLAAQSDHPVALHLLGVLMHQSGRNEQAVSLIEKALHIHPDYPEAYSNLGNIQREMRLLDAARDNLIKALTLKPNFPNALYNLGVTLSEQGALDEALVQYQKVLELVPQHEGALVNLGITLRNLERYEEAAQCYREAITVNPSNLIAYFNLGLLQYQQGKHQEAAFAFEKTVTLKPDYFDGFVHLARTQYQLGQLKACVKSYQTAARLKPNDAPCLYYLGIAHKMLGHYDEAFEAYTKALAITPEEAKIHIELGETLSILGRMDEAIERFERAIELEPNCPTPYLALSRIRPLSDGDAYLAHMNDLLTREDLDDEDRIALQYALGKAYADIGSDTQRAFEHYRAGAQLKRNHLKFSIATSVRFLESVADVFDAAYFMELSKERGYASQAPIFIVSMPRSGSTLIEQILSAHPEVYGADERVELREIIEAQAVRDKAVFPYAAKSWSDKTVASMGKAYCEAIQSETDKARFTDKMPLNFFYLGFIARALPNARIIHVRRNPVDTCWSCYTTLFRAGQEFTYDLNELGQYYSAYETLMSHWRKLLPEKMMIEVHYEDLIANPELEIRRLLDHCGLDWNSDCLEFNRSKRMVKTASFAQVRKPLHTQSIQRWKPYGKHLEPLLQALAPVLPYTTRSQLAENPME